uniref:Yeast cell wall synthesis Kre9/Knh1-like N-terminal domain-containing protein n=1 Tax=Mycena chlorophos TaxID=658473 RepID=A0ABQ0M450_MYCCL|nr:predicted protein [Mycena chlorophos]
MLLLRCCLLLAAALSPASAYFVVTAPSFYDQWVNGETHQVSWVKGSNDGVTSFDIEMSQLSAQGLSLIAKNVPSADSSQKSINIQLTDVPPGDDYFLLFVNSTNGVMYAVSPRFSVLASGASGNMSSSLNSKASTVTVSGSPNPTQAFATTFALAASGARRLAAPLLPQQTLGLSSAVLGCVLGALWTLIF